MIAATNGGTDIVSLLVENKADADLKDKNGNCALDYAIIVGHNSIVKTLMNVTSADIINSNSFNLAIANGHLDIVKSLIESGANVDSLDKSLMTPLHYAASKGCADIIRLLIEKGASINAVSGDSKTPLILACANNDLNAVELLINNGANPCVRDNFGYSPLMTAVFYANEKVADMLIKFEVKKGVNKFRLIDFNDALIIACSKGLEETIRALLANGADVNVKHNLGITPLICAARSAKPAVADILIKAGADIAHADSCGKTALHYAALGADAACFKILIEAGADLRAKDDNGQTPADIAINEGHQEFIDIIG